jgi:predicted O-methyltransferase YrrM
MMPIHVVFVEGFCRKSRGDGPSVHSKVNPGTFTTFRCRQRPVNVASVPWFSSARNLALASFATDILPAMQEFICLAPPPILKQIQFETERLGFGMASEPQVGALLRVLSATKPGGRLLELGTGTGLATAWLLAGMDESSTLVTVDTDAAVQSVARNALGADPRLQVVHSDAMEYLSEQPSQSFDLVFADALPGKYEGLAEALAVVKPGGLYVIDDMLPQANWPPGHAEKVPTLLNRLTSEPGFEVASIAWASGVVIAVRKAAGKPGDGPR